jgi:translocation and assembly module TamA
MQRSTRIQICSLTVLLSLFAAGLHAQQVTVEITGVNDDLRGQMLDSITLARQKEPERLTLSRVKALFSRASKEIGHVLETHGYYQPHITTKLSEEEAEHWRAVFHIEPGPRMHVTDVSLRLDGEGESDTAMRAALDAFPLKTGDPLSHAKYEQGKKHIENIALRRGYFDGAWRKHAIMVDVAKSSARIELQYDTGPRYRFGEITLPDTVISTRVLKRMLPFKTGDPYDSSLLITLSQTLRDSNYFSDVLVTPQKHDLHDQQVPVTLTLTPRRRNSYEIGGGFGTDTGPRLVAAWINHYFNRRGHRIEARLRLSPVLSSATASYILPYFRSRNAELGISTSLSHEDTTSRNSDIFKVGVQHLSKQWGWNRTLGLTYHYEDFSLAGTEESTQLMMPSIGYWLSVSDDPIYTRKGYRLSINLRGAVSGVISDISFVQSHVQAKVIHALGERGRIIARGEVGTTEVSNFKKLPASLRYYAGGSNSVRGFGFEALGPKDSNGKAIGGRHLLTGSLEYEYRFLDKWSGAVFTDFGNAFNSFQHIDLEYSVGAGIRWLSPVGPIRVDIGVGISRADNPVHLHIVAGPEL